MVACKTVCLRRLGGDRGGELRAGRFFASPKVTATKLIEGWSDRTSLAVAGRHVLAVQDTSEVAVPTTAQRRRGLGPVGRECVRRAGACDDRRARRNQGLSWTGGRRCLDPRRG